MTELSFHKVALSRRQILAAGGSAVLAAAALVAGPRLAWAAPADAKALLDKYTGGAAAKEGKVKIKLPKITDKGPMVPITVSIDSPMTESDYVKAFHIVGEQNTKPDIASYFLCADCGKAEITTRIRLKQTQKVFVVAEMSDGSFWAGTGEATVTAGGGGCG